jgi:hypothetical protein
VSTGMDESGMVWQLMFCFPKKEMLLKSGFLKKGSALEIWWTGSPVAIFENENQWELLRYLDGLVQRILL